jgi:hypothetical protein
MKPDPLAGLRDYHLPETIAWWPPAPGWWLLAAVAAVAAVLLLWWRRRRRGRGYASRLASQELTRLRARWRADADATAFLRGLSQLTRRFVLARFPGEPVAGLCGEDWLCYLAEKSAEPSFVDGPGRRLADAPYQAAGGAGDTAQVAAVADLVERLIERNAGPLSAPSSEPVSETGT